MARGPLNLTVIGPRRLGVRKGEVVHIYNVGTTAHASVYNSETGGTPLAQPLVTNADGELKDFDGVTQLWIEEGDYDEVVRGRRETINIPPSLTVGGPPSGPSGGVLGGNFPNPDFDAGFEVYVKRTDLSTNPANAASNVAAINAAVATVQALSKGGTVRIPAGDWPLAGTIASGQYQVNFKGAGQAATRCYWTTDPGAGAFGFDFTPETDDTIPVDRRRRSISDMTIEGIGVGAAASGIRWSSDTIIDRCVVKNWKYNLWVWGNHQAVHDSLIRGATRANAFYPNGMPTAGDQWYEGTQLTGSSWADLEVDSTQTMISTFKDCHFGFSRYGIYLNGTGGNAGMIGTRFDDCYWESFGAAMVKCADNKWVIDTNWTNPKFRHNDDYKGVEAMNAVFDLGTGRLQNCRVKNPQYDEASASVAPTSFLNVGSMVGCDFTEFGRVMDSIVAGAFAFVTASGDVEDNKVQWGDREAVIAKNVDGSTIAANTPVTLHATTPWSGTNIKTPQVIKATTGQKPFGVAVRSITNGALGLVAQRGAWTVPSSGTLAAGDAVAPASTGAVRTAVAGDPVCGIARSASGGGTVPIWLLPRQSEAAGLSVAKSIGTTKGDLIGFTGSGAPVRQGVGADGKVLTSQSAQADGLLWDTPIQAGTLASRPAAAAANTGYLYFATDSAGGTLYRSDGASWAAVARGLSEPILAALIDAKGDLISGTADNTPARKAVGADAKILTAQSGQSDGLLWDTVIQSGTLASRPAASTANAGYLYFATDDNGGTLYRSTGSAWTKVAPQLADEAAISPTLGANWATPAAAGNESVAYWKDAHGIVRIRGSIVAGPAAGAAVAFTLPAGYRPLNTITFSSRNTANTFATAATVVDNAGGVRPGGVAIGNQHFFDGVNFLAEA